MWSKFPHYRCLYHDEHLPQHDHNIFIENDNFWQIWSQKSWAQSFLSAQQSAAQLSPPPSYPNIRYVHCTVCKLLKPSLQFQTIYLRTIVSPEFYEFVSLFVCFGYWRHLSFPLFERGTMAVVPDLSHCTISLLILCHQYILLNQPEFEIAVKYLFNQHFLSLKFSSAPWSGTNRRSDKESTSLHLFLNECVLPSLKKIPSLSLSTRLTN